jgi:hypothetical protein
VKQETRIKIIFFLFNFIQKKTQTSSENSSSEQSVDNDVVAANVNYTKTKKLKLYYLEKDNSTLGG